MKDAYGVSSPAILIPAAAYNADNTPAAVDITGFESALVLIEVGVGGITFSGSNKVEFKLTHCDTVAGSYDAVAQSDVAGATVGTGGIVRSLIAAHATPTVVKVGYIGGRRFLKLLAAFTGTHGAATPLSAVVVRLEPHLGPVV
jgi:hypothetical protein